MKFVGGQGIDSTTVDRWRVLPEGSREEIAVGFELNVGDTIEAFCERPCKSQQVLVSASVSKLGDNLSAIEFPGIVEDEVANKTESPVKFRCHGG